MKSCKKKPNQFVCRNCLDMQIEHGEVNSCMNCSMYTDRYDIVDIQCTIFGAYAILLKDGELSKVSINDIYDVK